MDLILESYNTEHNINEVQLAKELFGICNHELLFEMEELYNTSFDHLTKTVVNHWASLNYKQE